MRLYFTIQSFLLLGIFSNVFAQKSNDTLVKRFFNDTATERISQSDYAQSVEKAFELLNGAQTEAVLDWKMHEAKRKLTDNRKIVRTIRKALNSHTNSGLRNLQLYGNILEDIQTSNSRIKELLDETAQRLEYSQNKIRTITSDTVIVYMIHQSAQDTLRKKYNRNKKLQKEYIYTSQLIKASLDSVNRWRSTAAFQAITSAELIQKTDSIMQQSNVQALKGDCSYLWHAKLKTGIIDSTGNDLMFGAGANNKIIGYYLQKNLSRILWIPLLIFILCFRWVWKNYKQLKEYPNPEILQDEHLRLTQRSYFLLPFILCFSLYPLLDVHAPWLFLLLSQILLMGVVTYYFLEKKNRGIIPIWFSFFALLVAISITNSFEPDLLQRIALIVLNAISVVVAAFLLSRVKLLPQIPRTVKFVTAIYIILNVSAIICNVFGRVIIGEALTNTAIIAITQVITLSFFIQALIEVLYLQLIASRIKRGIHPDFDEAPVLKSILKPVFVFSLLIWASMFLANLYMYEAVKDALLQGLAARLSIGSISFTVGNMLLFFVIIWIAHLLQTYIGSFFGDVENDEDVESKRQRSRMMVIKLAVICLGYLLAVAVSGLPLDKITIILGALGVGVGMGLQNMVNNFVSGVVLIFDKPLQIGDSIEVGANKGKVKTIGIRSSTLLTQDGAEVIIPNGDLLSNPITNWTLSNNQRRVDLEFTLQTTETKDSIIELIKKVLAESEDVVQEKEPVFMVENRTDNELKIKIYFWCNNISKADWIKSEVRYQLYGVFHERGIIVV